VINKILMKLCKKKADPLLELKQVTADHWSENVAGSDAFSADVYWLAVPAVQKRHQNKGCAGKPYGDWVEYCLREFLHTQGPAGRMLSIGCGSGALERQLFQLGAFEKCDAIDIAPTAIELAKAEAAAIGAGSSIEYRQVDVETVSLPECHYDAVWFNGSLHHINQLEAVCRNIQNCLKPGGWLFFNEYVGANHFGFCEKQRAAIGHTFNLIPERFRKSFVTGTLGQLVTVVPLPDPDEVKRTDPSEAVRSSEIMDVVEQHFEIKAINNCGGSLLQFVVHGIAGNFRVEDPESMRVLQMLFDIEDGLMESGTLKSDFVVVAARLKPHA
jgi:2-polyprenyl-3-methyl-5-hydroxy-6-metoxy-1,4-benzoquinol methylase